MKEIIYIQAGTCANYTGTHFWNTQESYLSEGEDNVKHDLDVSFRESLGPTGEPTVCPRLLIFDRKANFGTLSGSNALGADEDELPSVDSPVIWSGDVMEYRQDRIPESPYFSNLVPTPGEEEPDSTSNMDKSQTTDDIRYWSDFSRMYYIPRTIQALPDCGEWENTDGDWNKGQEEYVRYNEDTALMDGSFRLFLEECDSLQGIQIMNDTSSFGGFIKSFIVSLRDESAKLPCLVFPLLSDSVSRDNSVRDNRSMKKIINDALYLHSLYEHSSLTVPIQAPSVWPSDAWGQSTATGRNSMYYNSAILSAHIESSTLALRLPGTDDDVANMAAQLNWRGSTPFSELSGVFPITPASDFGNQLVNFSIDHQHDYSSPQFARRDVTRGFSHSELTAYSSWSASLPLQESFVSRLHAPPYPIPTSYPLFFDASRPSRPGVLIRPCGLFSSLATSSSSATLFSFYATSIETCLKRRPVVGAVGIDKDELKQLSNDLWSLHDNFRDGGDGPDIGIDSDSLGEDE